MSPIGVRLERKIDLEGRSDVDPAHHVDRAEVSLDDRSNDRQPQSEPAGVPAAAGVRPGETVEDAIEIFIRDPRPRVAERDDRRAVASTDGDLDRVLLARVLHRVLDQRIERHGQPVAVGQDDRLLGGTEHPPTGRRRPTPERVDDDLRHVHGDQVELLRVLGPRKQEQTVDEAPQARQLVRDHVHVLDDRRIRGTTLDQLRVAEGDRDRRPELVRRILHESPLAFEEPQVLHGHALGLLHGGQPAPGVPHHGHEHRGHQRHLGDLVERLRSSASSRSR